jgi:hypothetical protein
MSRSLPVVLFSAALCVAAATNPKPAAAQTTIPAYFFNAWTVNRDCTEAHSGGRGHTIPGLQFRVSPVSADGQTYSLQAVNTKVGRWARGWQNVKLEYRTGARMNAIPADMECVPGQEETSPFLAQSGFASSAEPYYGYEHWYGQVTIHGENHHLLIFPRATQSGPSSAAVLLIDVDANGNMQLDNNGTIVVEN